MVNLLTTTDESWWIYRILFIQLLFLFLLLIVSNVLGLKSYETKILAITLCLTSYTFFATVRRRKLIDPKRKKVRFRLIGPLALLLLLISYHSLTRNQTITSATKTLMELAAVLRSVAKSKSIPSVVSQPFEEIWKEPQSSQQLFEGDTKIMWAYWDSGFEGMPPICQRAIRSWEIHNSKWRVIILNDTNYREYVSVRDLPSTYYSLKVQHRSDFLRLAVLLRYGGIYMDASTFVVKCFDDIWDRVDNDKLMVTSLNTLSESNLDLFNNGLLMTKGTNNEVLRLWQQRMLEYSENPNLTLKDMAQNPEFARVAPHWNAESLGILAQMVPYHSNLWIFNDLIWNNQDIADKVLSLSRTRWGFWFHSLHHLTRETRSPQNVANTNHTADATTDPATVTWKPLGLFKVAIDLLRVALNEDVDLANHVMQNTNVLKFSSHDIRIVDIFFQNFGLDNTLGYLYRAATNMTLFPLQQANLAGAVRPVSVGP